MPIERLLSKQTRLLSLVLTLVLSIFSVLVLITIVNVKHSQIEMQAVSHYKDKNVYYLVDNLYNQEEKDFFSLSDSMRILNRFSHELRAQTEVVHYNAVWQPILISDFAGEVHFDAYYEEGHPRPPFQINGRGKRYRNIKSVQVNAAVLETDLIQAQEGRLFSPEDYGYNPKKRELPVVLGSNYRGVYHVGDTLDISHYTRPYTGVVVGILDSSQKIMSTYSPELYLDNYIMLPLFHFSDETDFINGHFFNASLLRLVNGFLITDLSPLEVNRFMDELSKKAGFREFQVAGANTLAVSSLIKMTEANRQLLLGSVLVSGLLSGLLILWSLAVTVKKNISAFKVFFISGATLRQVLSGSRNFLTLLLVISQALPVLVLLTVMRELNIIILYAASILLIYSAFLGGAHLYLRKMLEKLDIPQQLKG